MRRPRLTSDKHLTENASLKMEDIYICIPSAFSLDSHTAPVSVGVGFDYFRFSAVFGEELFFFFCFVFN